MKFWTVSEWGRLPYGEGPDRIPAPLADRIAAAARASPLAGRHGENVLEQGRHDLRAKQMVGVVAAEGCALEILPKIDGLGEASDAEGRGRVRERLVRLLAVALDLKIAPGRMVSLGWQRHHLLEILIRLFADQLLDQVRLGLPRQYVAREEDLPALRGRLDAVRQFTTLASSPQKLACRFDSLSPDILINRTMKVAILRLQGMARAPETQRRLRELAFAYAEISPLARGSTAWENIVLDRTNARWHGPLALARLLLDRRYQTTSAGTAEGISLLFDMNLLFERYVAALLRRACQGSALRVAAQSGGLFCLREIEEDGRDGRRCFRTKPDILLKRAGRVEMLLDTKWKRLDPPEKDKTRNLSQADVYQMMAYASLYCCPRLMLFYPHHGALGREEGVQGSYRIDLGGERLDVVTLDLAREHHPDKVRSILSSALDEAA